MIRICMWKELNVHMTKWLDAWADIYINPKRSEDSKNMS